MSNGHKLILGLACQFPTWYLVFHSLTGFNIESWVAMVFTLSLSLLFTQGDNLAREVRADLESQK